MMFDIDIKIVKLGVVCIMYVNIGNLQVQPKVKVGKNFKIKLMTLLRKTYVRAQTQIAGRQLGNSWLNFTLSMDLEANFK